MVDLIIVVASLAISAMGSVCVPICISRAHTDVIEHVVIVNETVVDLEDIDKTK